MATAAPYRVILLRQESVFNQENRFCGWHDADLSANGVEQAKNAGKVNDVFWRREDYGITKQAVGSACPGTVSVKT